MRTLKIKENFHSRFSFTRVDKMENIFAIFWLIAFDTKKTKSSLENSNYSVFLIIFMWRDTVPKW